MNWTRRRLPSKKLASLNVPTRLIGSMKRNYADGSKIKRALYEAFITPEKRLDPHVISDVADINYSPIKPEKSILESYYDIELPIIRDDSCALPSSGSSSTPIPTMSELGQRIDEVEERVQCLNECCENILKLIKKIL